MTTLSDVDEAIAETMADVLRRLGDVSPERVRMHPTPGAATEADAVAIEDHENRHFELVDGVLVEKAMGFHESILAFAIGRILGNWVEPRNLGIVAGVDLMVRLFPGLVRMPDVGFVSWDRIPGGRLPEEPILGIAPDLAVEVLSKSNTRREMARKREEYFKAGVRLVWMVDRIARTVIVYTGPEAFVVVKEDEILDGGEVLPGFTISLRELFAERKA